MKFSWFYKSLFTKDVAVSLHVLYKIHHNNTFLQRRILFCHYSHKINARSTLQEQNVLRYLNNILSIPLKYNKKVIAPNFCPPPRKKC